MNKSQFEFLDNLVNRTIFLKARQFGDEIWELEEAGLVSLKWDGQFFAAKPTLAGRERIERELARREADKISHERDAELKASLERERDEAKRTANRELKERRFWQGATILAMIFSAIISGRTLSCSSTKPMLAEKTNDNRDSLQDGNRICSMPEQEPPERIADKIAFDEVATNHAYPLPMPPDKEPKSDSDKNQTMTELGEDDTDHTEQLKKPEDNSLESSPEV